MIIQNVNRVVNILCGPMSIQPAVVQPHLPPLRVGAGGVPVEARAKGEA